MPLSTRELIAVAERRDEEAKAAFSKYDVDGSGKIDHTDILCVLDDLGLVKKLKSGATNFVADYNASLGAYTSLEQQGNGCIHCAKMVTASWARLSSQKLPGSGLIFLAVPLVRPTE
eukprot:scaffold243917_cov33-Tisochrysis_lutea.AAC.3